MDELNEKAPANIIITLVGNKVDLEENREVKAELAQEYAKSVGMQYREVSAKENINIVETFTELAKQLPTENPFKKKNGMNLKATTEKKAEESTGFFGSYC